MQMTQEFIRPLRRIDLALIVTQKLHTVKKGMQVVDLIDYFSGVTIEWE